MTKIFVVLNLIFLAFFLSFFNFLNIEYLIYKSFGVLFCVVVLLSFLHPKSHTKHVTQSKSIFLSL